MSYDDWKLMTPEEDWALRHPRRRRTQRDLEDGTPYDGPDDPPEDDDPDDADATPLLDDPEDPGEHLEPHKPDLGGES